MAQNQQNSGDSDNQSALFNAQETSRSELVIGAIGLLLVLAIIGFLVYEGFRTAEPPDIIVGVTNISDNGTYYLVEISVSNQGGHTAEELMVKGELLPQDSSSQPVETAEITFSYVPPNSQRQGGLLFTHNPQDYRLKLRPSSYTNP